MPTPKGGYFVDGVKVPSVTTVIGRFKESGGLIYWAWKVGSEGKTLEEARDAPAAAGTVAHALVEAKVRNRPLPTCEELGCDPDVYAVGTKAFGSFLTWWHGTGCTIIDTEVGIASQKHKFGGTMDAIGQVNGELVLFDWKSSNALYADVLLQLAAYGILWEEAHPDQPLTGGFHVVRFAKEHGDFEHRHFPAIEDARRMFLLLLEAYSLDKQLKKRLK